VPRRTARVAVVTLALLSVLAMVPTAQAAVVVRGYSTNWSPTSVSIGRGGQVQWRSILGHHDVRAYGRNWSYARDIPQGAATAARTFRKRGTFRFYCTIHGHVHNGHCTGMCGRVVVG
jgi:plastocyanin